MDAAVPLDNQVTLSQVPSGTQARISQIRGGKMLTRRLLALGLRVGSVILVVQQRRRGVVVASAGTRVALGGTVAEKLLMQPLDS